MSSPAARLTPRICWSSWNNLPKGAQHLLAPRPCTSLFPKILPPEAPLTIWHPAKAVCRRAGFTPPPLPLPETPQKTRGSAILALRTTPSICNPRLTNGCGRSSGVEHNLAKVRVESSNLFARSNWFTGPAGCLQRPPFRAAFCIMDQAKALIVPLRGGIAGAFSTGCGRTSA